MRIEQRNATLGVAVFLLAAAASTAAPSPSLEVMHAFTSAQGSPVGNPVVGPDGTIYGVTQYGGIFAGSIFALTPDGTGGFAYSELHAFRVYDGYQPQAGLILGSDGLLYGTTSGGGLPEGQGFGTVFRFDPASRALTTLHVFSGTDGSWPQAALTEAPDGSFYGTARFGGDDVNMGTVFRLDSAGNFTRLHSFSGTDGRQPMGRLYRTPDGDLYGTTARGASDADDGAIFRIDSQGMFSVVHAFTGAPTDGSVPRSGLLLASDGQVYGTTGSGGVFDHGTIYRLVLGAVTVVHSFGESDGAVPMGDPATADDGTIVGTTEAGGANDLGTVYRFTLPATVSTLHSFSGPDGENPISGPAVDSSGEIFGVTWEGGANSIGVVFQVDPDGGETVIHAFVPEGGTPIAPLMQASNGKILGVATYPFGSIFQWDLASASISSPVTFPNLDYLRAWGGLAETPDGWFYGTSAGDSSSPNGIVYRARMDGSVETLHHFGEDGVWPLAGLVLAQDGNLYGTTSNSKALGGGGPFRIDPEGGYTFLGYFDPSTVGGSPCGRFVESSPGVFVGGLAGGPTFAGSVSTFDSVGSQSLIYGFSTDRRPDGSGPCSDVTLGSDGFYYGTTLSGQASDGSTLMGTAFRVSPGGELSLLAQFHGPDGNFPKAGLTEASPGVFYGTTLIGGSSDAGTIFRTDVSGRFESLYSFDGAAVGANPYGNLLLASDGFLYGTTSAGGWWAGTLFRLSVGTPAVSVEPTSGPADAPVPFVVTGSNFQPNAGVTVGGVAAGDIFVNGGTVGASSPILSPGTLNHVQVLNADMTSSTVIDGWMADFLDVPQGDIFHAYVETLVRHRLSAGVGNGEFGRDDPMQRSQMAVLLLKAEHGSGYVPPGCAGVFSDVSCPGPFSDWIEQLAAEGITGGCAPGLYCPTSPVSRAQMAVFLLKSEHGPGYVPSACGSVFADVACPSLFADWVEGLYAEGVTGGCSAAPLLYCPDNPNTRGQAATLIVKAFHLQ